MSRHYLSSNDGETDFSLGHVLIVEDEPAIAEVLQTLLNQKHCPCRVAGTVSEATIELLSRPSWMILDLGLPDGNGLDLIAHVRLRRLSTRILILTAESQPEVLAAAQRLGAEALSQKPIELDAVVNLVVESRAGQVA
jgi:DNA-binding response OmpR family regulator